MLRVESETALNISRFIFYGLIIGCMVFPHELEGFFAPVGFMKIYVFDLAFMLIFGCIAGSSISYGFLWKKLSFNKLVAAYLALGLVASAVGYFISGNPYNNVLGDFRRTFFYFMAYSITIALTQRSNHLKILEAVLIIGATGAMVKGLFQLSTGDFDVRRTGDAAHILNHFETTFCTLGIYWAITRVHGLSLATLPYLLLATVGTVIVAVANFRTCWIAFLVGLGCTFLFTATAHKMAVARSAAVTFLSVAVALSLLWFIPVSQNSTSLGKNLEAKVNFVALSSDQNIQWRINSYKNAIGLWNTSPLLGRGLGEILSFETSTSSGGTMTVSGHRVHNSYIWFLMSTGVLGFSFFAYFHLHYFHYVAKAILRSVSGRRNALVPLLSFYAAMMITAAFDVFLEGGPPTIILSTSMAVTLLEVQRISHQTHYHEVPV